MHGCGHRSRLTESGDVSDIEKQIHHSRIGHVLNDQAEAGNGAHINESSRAPRRALVVGGSGGLGGPSARRLPARLRYRTHLFPQQQKE
ncbi:MAG: hypothetical protein QOG75_6811 [Mycobacterium sp.]|jgi:hypothetical protein|nr:hypothetical protein [Mycobacterium sp.]